MVSDESPATLPEVGKSEDRLCRVGSKFCKTCGIEQPIENFNRGHGGVGHRHKCRSCHSKECREYNLAHKQERLEKQHREYQENRLAIRQKVNEYRSRPAVRARILELRRKKIDQYRPKKIQWEREHRAERMAKARIYQAQKRKADPMFRLVQDLRSRVGGIVRSLKIKKAASTFALLGCSIEQFKTHIESQFQPGMTWENFGRGGWHIDHRRPCKSFDLTNPCHQALCFSYSNLQPLWEKDNIMKSDSVVVDGRLITSADLEAEKRRVQEMISSGVWDKIEAMEAPLEKLPDLSLPLRHVFTNGMYVREIQIPAGTLLTTRIHLTQHVFIISKGIVSVWDEEHGVMTFHAPHTGVTQPGTRRVLFAHTDVVWVTCHPNPDNCRDPDEIVRRVTYSEGKFKDLRGAAAAATPQIEPENITTITK